MRIVRIALALVATVPAFGQGLTTIQDTLFKADGTRFNGSLTIQWSTFDSSGVGTIVQQSKSVQVLNGNVMVQLAPNAGAAAPANVYRVLYQSDGKNQFSETWSVPSSSGALSVATVRTGTLATGGGTTSGTGAQTPVLEADIIGLLNDLDQRPVKGSGFGTGRVAVVNQNGEVDTVVGDVADCVRVDGTSGPCGGASTPTFVDAETPGGVVDGTNNTFTLANTPSGNSLMLFRNGMYMTPGFDYTLTGNSFQFIPANVPQPLDTLTVSYRVDASPAPITLPGGGAPSTKDVQVLCSATGTSTTSSTYISLGSCNVPLAMLNAGDRIEVRLTMAHSGTASAWDVQASLGTSTFLQRHGAVQDALFAARTDATVGESNLQFATESYGTVLAMLPSLQTTTAPAGDMKVDIRAELSKKGTADRIALQSYTVIRYPAN